MRLAGKKLLLIVMDGVDYQEYEDLKRGLEEENALVYVATPQEYLTVETIYNGRRGKDILADLPFEVAGQMQFDGLLIPNGMLSADLLSKNDQVIQLVANFHQKGLPIIASGNAVQVLYESQVLSEQVLVREETPIDTFLSRAVSLLVDRPANRGYRSMYRPTM